MRVVLCDTATMEPVTILDLDRPPANGLIQGDEGPVAVTFQSVRRGGNECWLCLVDLHSLALAIGPSWGYEWGRPKKFVLKHLDRVKEALNSQAS